MLASGTSQWVIVVARGREDLLLRLGRSFGPGGCVNLLVDRRQGPRAGVAPGPRGAFPSVAAAGVPRGGESSYRVIQEADGYHVVQMMGGIAADCPDCSTTIEFEMPRFVEPAARLVVDVVHLDERPAVQHHVEIEAFTATGRSLLACRVQARRPPGTGAPPGPDQLRPTRALAPVGA